MVSFSTAGSRSGRVEAELYVGHLRGTLGFEDGASIHAAQRQRRGEGRAGTKYSPPPPADPLNNVTSGVRRSRKLTLGERVEQRQLSDSNPSHDCRPGPSITERHRQAQLAQVG